MIDKNKKTIALVAHDGKKDDLIGWINYNGNSEKLAKFNLVGTATTSALIKKTLGIDVDVLEPKEFASGPKGGDVLIGAEILKSNIYAIIFFIDPMEAPPHQVDIQTLIRTAIIKNIPIAVNKATADTIITSALIVGEKH